MSERDMSPEDAAQFAQGEVEGSRVSGHGSGHGPENSGSVVDRLLDGSASGPAKDRVAQDYDLDNSLALVLRGVLRAAPGDGMPPLGDIALGGLLFAREQSGSDGSEDSGETDNVDVDIEGLE